MGTLISLGRRDARCDFARAAPPSPLMPPQPAYREGRPDISIVMPRHGTSDTSEKICVYVACRARRRCGFPVDNCHVSLVVTASTAAAGAPTARYWLRRHRFASSPSLVGVTAGGLRFRQLFHGRASLLLLLIQAAPHFATRKARRASAGQFHEPPSLWPFSTHHQLTSNTLMQEDDDAADAASFMQAAITGEMRLRRRWGATWARG